MIGGVALLGPHIDHALEHGGKFLAVGVIQRLPVAKAHPVRVRQPEEGRAVPVCHAALIVADAEEAVLINIQVASVFRTVQIAGHLVQTGIGRVGGLNLVRPFSNHRRRKTDNPFFPSVPKPGNGHFLPLRAFEFAVNRLIEIRVGVLLARCQHNIGGDPLLRGFRPRRYDDIGIVHRPVIGAGHFVSAPVCPGAGAGGAGVRMVGGRIRRFRLGGG